MDKEHIKKIIFPSVPKKYGIAVSESHLWKDEDVKYFPNKQLRDEEYKKLQEHKNRRRN